MTIEETPVPLSDADLQRVAAKLQAWAGTLEPREIVCREGSRIAEAFLTTPMWSAAAE